MPAGRQRRPRWNSCERRPWTPRQVCSEANSSSSSKRTDGDASLAARPKPAVGRLKPTFLLD